MMNNIIKKCSCVEHEEINAISYCFECKVNMCKKCENFIQNYANFIIAIA